MERITIEINEYKRGRYPTAKIELDVTFHPDKMSQQPIYMDSSTKKGNILNSFRMGMLITLLYKNNLIPFTWESVEKSV